jgi:hypothetical protein
VEKANKALFTYIYLFI